MVDAAERSNEFRGAELVGAVSTFYPNTEGDIRFELALDTAERYQQAGLPLVVVDGSPLQDGRDVVGAAHRERGATVIRAEINGIATQRQQGVKYAVENGATKVVGQEPEKNLMVNFASEISRALDTVDILVIGRTEEAEASLPPMQRRTERLAGWLLEKGLFLPADALSGGRGFSVAGAEVLASYPSEQDGMNNWIYLYETVLRARQMGLTADSIKVDLTHPATMVEDETGNPVFDKKRFDQFSLQLDYLLNRSDVNPDPNLRGMFETVRLGVTVMKDRSDRKSNIQAIEEPFAIIEDEAVDNGYVPAQAA